MTLSECITKIHKLSEKYLNDGLSIEISISLIGVRLRGYWDYYGTGNVQAFNQILEYPLLENIDIDEDKFDKIITRFRVEFERRIKEKEAAQ